MAMAVAVDTAQCKDNFLPVVDEGEEYEIMSETGVMYEMEDIEEMVFAEIRKILKARQRPFTESICKSLHKAKGLTRSKHDSNTDTVHAGFWEDFRLEVSW